MRYLFPIRHMHLSDLLRSHFPLLLFPRILTLFAVKLSVNSVLFAILCTRTLSAFNDDELVWEQAPLDTAKIGVNVFVTDFFQFFCIPFLGVLFLTGGHCRFSFISS